MQKQFSWYKTFAFYAALLALTGYPFYIVYSKHSKRTIAPQPITEEVLRPSLKHFATEQFSLHVNEFQELTASFNGIDVPVCPDKTTWLATALSGLYKGTPKPSQLGLQKYALSAEVYLEDRVYIHVYQKLKTLPDKFLQRTQGRQKFVVGRLYWSYEGDVPFQFVVDDSALPLKMLAEERVYAGHDALHAMAVRVLEENAMQERRLLNFASARVDEFLRQDAANAAARRYGVLE